jgi:hypothetical protein
MVDWIDVTIHPGETIPMPPPSDKDPGAEDRYGPSSLPSTLAVAEESSRVSKPVEESAFGAPTRENGEALLSPSPDSGLVEEVDLWWGSYATRTMLPSFLVCVAATVAVAWLTWVFLPPGFVKPTFVALAGSIWLLQLVRWGYRFFGFNYRLTTRRVVCSRGLLYGPGAELDLATVARVHVYRRWDERLLQVGQVTVQPDNPNVAPLILEGLVRPAAVAQMIRAAAKKAREEGVLQTRASAEE